MLYHINSTLLLKGSSRDVMLVIGSLFLKYFFDGKSLHSILQRTFDSSPRGIIKELFTGIDIIFCCKSVEVMSNIKVRWLKIKGSSMVPWMDSFSPFRKGFEYKNPFRELEPVPIRDLVSKGETF